MCCGGFLQVKSISKTQCSLRGMFYESMNSEVHHQRRGIVVSKGLVLRDRTSELQLT